MFNAVVTLHLALSTLGSLDAPTASTTIEELAAQCLRRTQQVQSGVLEYEMTTTAVQVVAGWNEGQSKNDVPYFIRFAWESNRRAIYEAPTSDAEQHGSFSVYDGRSTVIGSLRDYQLTGIRGRAAMIMEGREANIRNYGDYYLGCALELPTSDAGRADYVDGWWFPNCVTRLNTGTGEFGRYALRPLQEQVDGHWCDVVELPGFDRVWLDPKLNYAIRQRMRWNSPKTPHILSRHTNSDFRETIPGFWIPYHVVAETGCGPAGVCQRTIVKLIQFRVNESQDSDFRIRLLSGATVTDIATGKSTIYREEFGDASIDLLTREARRHFRSSHWFLLIAGIFGVAGVGVLVLFWQRRRRANR